LNLKDVFAKITSLFQKRVFEGNDDSVMAVDIGSHTIKVLHGFKKGGDITIKNLSSVNSPTIMNKISYYDDISSESEIIIGKIEALLENFAAESNSFFISLPDNFSVLKFLTVEESPDSPKFKEAIRAGIEPNLPHPYEFWEIISDTIESHDKSYSVLVMATLKKNYEALNDFFCDAVAEPDFVSCSSVLAFETLYAYLDAAGDSNIAVVNMGHTTTTVSIFKGAHLRAMQTLYGGGYNFTIDVTNAMQISTSESEKFKKNELFFLPEYVPQQEKIKNFITIKPSFMELTRGIFYIFESYFTQYFEEKIDEIILFGGGSNFNNIEVTIGGILNTPAKKASSIVKAKYVDGTPVEDDIVNQFLPLLGAICGGISNESKT